MMVPVVRGEMPVSVWLRQQREARAWGRRELARQLIQAGRDAEDTAMPSVDGVASVRGERDAPGIRWQYRPGAGWMTPR